MKVKIKKLDEKAVIPTKGTKGSAGYDLTAISVKPNPEKGYVEYKTGLAISVPPGCVGLLFPRSSVSNTVMTLANSVGVLDSDYTGEVTFRFRVALPGSKIYKAGERVGQLVVVELPKVELEEVQELEETERGSGGYGSTNV